MRVCTNCGQELLNKYSFCWNCGTKVEKTGLLQENQPMSKNAQDDNFLTFSKGLKIEDGVVKGIGLCNDKNIVIPYGVVGIDDRAFRICTKIESVTIPEGTIYIGSSAFRGCVKLNKIIFPKSLTSIGTSAFRDCTGLSIIKIGEGVKVIGEDAFSDCTKLVSVILPTSLTNIKMFAFFSCTSLEVINYLGNKKQWENVKKASDWNYKTKGKVVCIDGEINKSNR